jgi:hypothetical protein
MGKISQMSVIKEQPVIIVNKIQFVIGLIALFSGALVYLGLRSPDHIYFTKYFGIHEPWFKIDSQVLHIAGQRLPAFLHVFSFILITASFFAHSKKIYAAICGGWLLVDCFFELGQKYKAQAARLVFDFFDKIPFLESTRNFFLLGTFDVFDLMASALGAAAAFWVLTATAKRH